MPARLIKSSISLLTLLIELRYTLSRLLASPLTVAFAPVFQALRDQWTTVQAKEIALNEALSDAQAQVDSADSALDDFAARFSNAILIITGQKRDAPLYVFFFKKPLNEFRKPVLNGQLKEMAAWLVALDTTPHPSLAAMKGELSTLVDAGKKAAAQRDAVQLDLRNFRDQGERQKLFDLTNGERKDLEGSLAKIALSTGLPVSFPSQFFKPGDSGDAAETIDSVTAEIADLNGQLAERKARLAELTKEETDAKAEADAKAKADAKAELDALTKEIEDKQKKAKELQDKLT